MRKQIGQHLKTLVHKLLFLFSWPCFHAFYDILRVFALAGMGIGTGDRIESSGEILALRRMRYALIHHYAAQQWVVFDVGANQGDFTAAAITALGSRASIYAFEPSQTTYDYLIKCNFINAKLYNFGFSNKHESLMLHSIPENSGLASLYARKLDHFSYQPAQSSLVQLKTMDDFCRENHISRIHILKMDIEGHEFSALQGAKNLLSSQCINFIQFEFGGCNIDSRRFFQDFYYLLCPLYDIYRILPHGMLKIKKYSERDEVFVTTNYLAVLKNMSF